MDFHHHSPITAALVGRGSHVEEPSHEMPAATSWEGMGKSGQTLETLAHYASQRPTILPKIGSANGDATGSQLGSSASSGKTVLNLGRRSPLRARGTSAR